MNTFGRIFRLTTFGESHGPAMGGILDGCPPGLPLAEKDIQKQLDRRRPNQSKWTTLRREEDKIQILSGVFEGHTTGTSIGLMIHNTDARSRDYADIKDKFRPGHADWSYHKKYGRRDYRGGGRSSARETALWVAAGAIARKLLHMQNGISIYASLTRVGDLKASSHQPETIEKNPFFCADPDMVKKIGDLLDKMRKEGDSVGGLIRVVATGVPPGWGSPVFGRLDADIAGAMMGINAAKAVAIGVGFDAAGGIGSQQRDELTKDGFTSNHAGGILGGISTGQEIVADIAFKPTSSILKPAQTLDTAGNETEVRVKGRHDPCVAIRAVPIVEAMLALVLTDQKMLHEAQCGTGSRVSGSSKPTGKN